MLYVESVSSIMFDVSWLTVPTNISNLFIKATGEHNHYTRFSSFSNFYINPSGLNQSQGSFASFVAKLWNSICDALRKLPKRALKKLFKDMLFSFLEAEDTITMLNRPLYFKKLLIINWLYNLYSTL